METPAASPPPAALPVRPPPLPRPGLIKAPAYFWCAVVLLVAVLAVGVLVRLAPPTTSHLYPRCLLHEVTGLFCPGCGATRAVAALLTGHPLQALAYNAFVMLALPFAAGWWASLVYQAFTARPLWRWRAPLWLPLAIVIVVLSYGLLRNLPWYPLTLLAPHGL